MLTASGIKKLQQLRANLNALIADHAEQKEIAQSVAGFIEIIDACLQCTDYRCGLLEV